MISLLPDSGFPDSLFVGGLQPSLIQQAAQNESPIAEMARSVILPISLQLSRAIRNVKEPEVRALLQAKADPCLELPDLNGYIGPPLLQALNLSAPDNLINLLIEFKADLSHLNPRRAFVPFRRIHLQNESNQFGVRFLKSFLQAEGEKVFDTCKNVHDVFSLLFPPSKDRLPPDWESVISKIPKMRKIDNLEKWLRDNPGQKWPALKDIKQVLESIGNWTKPQQSYPAAYLLDLLQKMHPLFYRAWREFGSNVPKIEERTLSGRSAFYSPERHTICIPQNESNLEKIQGLVWETMNALVGNIDLPELGREEFALATEYLEKPSFDWTNKILENSPELSFERNWTGANREGSHSSGLAHAEYYRRTWDVKHGFKYLVGHPEEVRQRMAQLKSPKENPESK